MPLLRRSPPVAELPWAWAAPLNLPAILLGPFGTNTSPLRGLTLYLTTTWGSRPQAISAEGGSLRGFWTQITQYFCALALTCSRFSS